MVEKESRGDIILKPYIGARVLNLTIPEFLAKLLKIKVGDRLYVKKIEDNKLYISNREDAQSIGVTVRHCTGKVKGKKYLGVTIPKRIADIYRGKKLKLVDFYAVPSDFYIIFEPILGDLKE